MDISYYEQYLQTLQSMLKQANVLEDAIAQNADKHGNKKDIEYAGKMSNLNSSIFKMLMETYEMMKSNNR